MSKNNKNIDKSTTKLSNIINKAKELYENLSPEEKEELKEKGSKVKEVVKEAIDEKKSTGKISGQRWINIVFAIGIFGSFLYNSVTSPINEEVIISKTVDSVEVLMRERDSLYNELEAKAQELDSVTVKAEQLEKIIRMDSKGNIEVGE